MTRKYEWIIELAIALIVLLSATLLFFFTNLDIEIEEYFYDPLGGWVHGDKNPWKFLYEYGTIPALVVAWSFLGVFIVSLWNRKLRPYRVIAVFFALVMIVGPGLITNNVFKQNWGRSRPKDIVNFNGDESYQRVWVKGDPSRGESFPSGHATMGFYWLTPYFILRRHSKKWALFFLSLGLLFGSFMGLGRMVQGSHFPSDVLWSGGFVYLTAFGFFYLLKLNRRLYLEE
jgi:membrane-associated PAP2 superfamily phosphatase